MSHDSQSLELVDLSDPQRRSANTKLLYSRMIEFLSASDPKLRLQNSQFDEVQIILAQLLAGEALSYEFGSWSTIWRSIEWENGRDSSGPRYGVRLLELIGYLGEACARHGEVTFPLSTLLTIMVDIQPAPYLLKYKIHKGQMYLRPTAEGKDLLGCKGRLGSAEEISPSTSRSSYSQWVRRVTTSSWRRMD